MRDLLVGYLAPFAIMTVWLTMAHVIADGDKYSEFRLLAAGMLFMLAQIYLRQT